MLGTSVPDELRKVFALQPLAVDDAGGAPQPGAPGPVSDDHNR